MKLSNKSKRIIQKILYIIIIAILLAMGCQARAELFLLGTFIVLGILTPIIVLIEDSIDYREEKK